ncbi:MAG: hypothetical protein RL660_194 [Bacteroidota bacterium]
MTRVPAVVFRDTTVVTTAGDVVFREVDVVTTALDVVISVLDVVTTVADVVTRIAVCRAKFGKQAAVNLNRFLKKKWQYRYAKALVNFVYKKKRYLQALNKLINARNMAPRRKKRRSLKVAGTTLRLSLQPLIAARHIHQPFAFLLRLGFTSHAASKAMRGTLYTVTVVQLEALCKGFGCRVGDLFGEECE